jgi:hypothetical protein
VCSSSDPLLVDLCFVHFVHWFSTKVLISPHKKRTNNKLSIIGMKKYSIGYKFIQE